MTYSINLVILNYNGAELLRRFLPSVVKAAERSRHRCCVTVLDNASRDESEKVVKEGFSSVRWVAAPENKVLCSYNDFASSAAEDLLILLNNDLELSENFVDPLAEAFEKHPDAFFSCCFGNRSIPSFRWGILSCEIDYPGCKEKMKEPGLAFSAGVPMVDRKKFIELGGFDDLYLPGRYEDVDLCFRAWKKGWRGYYEPRSDHFHLEAASFNKSFGFERIQAMVFRNSVLFMIKNITDPFLLARFWILLGPRVIYALLTGKWYIMSGLMGVFPRLSAALRARRSVKKHFKLSDREVLSRLAS